MTRERIRLEDRAVKMSVKTVGKEKVGVLDIPGFYVGLTDDVKVQLQKLEKQNVSSVIIDLRSNGGGALTEAVSLSGLFIPAGPIVQVRDNNGKVREDSDTDGQVFYKFPDRVLCSKEELVGYMVEKMQLTSSDVAIIDRTTGIGPAIMRNCNDRWSHPPYIPCNRCYSGNSICIPSRFSKSFRVSPQRSSPDPPA